MESVHPMTMDEVFRRSGEGELFTPDGLKACEEYMKFKQQNEEDTEDSKEN